MISFFANHLWQSTLFAIGAALLTFFLRNNGAHTRYWVWFAVTIKFLIPFSLLVSLGNQFQWRISESKTVGAHAPMAQWVDAVDKIARPMDVQPVASTLDTVSPAAVEVRSTGVDLTRLVFIAWAVGFLAVVSYWLARWLQLRSIVRSSQPLTLALAMDGAPSQSLEMRASSVLVEPGIVGVFNPVLLMPTDIQKRLSENQLRAIVAHEISHLRRRDNLTAAIHMFVEALFWFHPLVWWVGARLIAERERACDEAVLKSGNSPEAYAEGILNVCEFYVASPLACAAGVSGADLKKRIEFIARNQVMDTVHFVKKLTLGLTAAVVVSGPIVVGALTAPLVHAQTMPIDPSWPSFATATITVGEPTSLNRALLRNPKGEFTTRNWPLRGVIGWAYDLQDSQIDGPDEQLSIVYSISAKAGDGFTAAPNGGKEQLQLMTRRLLAERFQLVFHNETKRVPVFVLTSGQGAGMKLAKSGDPGPSLARGLNSINGSAAPMGLFNSFLATQLHRPILDQTGLAGTYNFRLKWGPEQGEAGAPTAPQNPSVEVLAQALQEQLGLNLSAQEGDVQRLVVDKLQKPSDVVPPPTEAKVDPAVFDRYVGHYDFASNRLMTVSRDGDKFLTQLSGQSHVQIFAISEREYFAKVVDARISFVVDANEQVTELVLHQNGQDMRAPRLGEEVARARMAAFEKRVTSKTAAPGSEAAIRKHIESLRSENPNYDDMSQNLADAVRKQWPQMKTSFLQFGAVKSISFKEVGPGGADVYDVEFENAKTEWRIVMLDSVKVQGLGFRKLPPT